MNKEVLRRALHSGLMRQVIQKHGYTQIQADHEGHSAWRKPGTMHFVDLFGGGWKHELIGPGRETAFGTDHKSLDAHLTKMHGKPVDEETDPLVAANIKAALPQALTQQVMHRHGWTSDDYVGTSGIHQWEHPDHPLDYIFSDKQGGWSHHQVFGLSKGLKARGDDHASLSDYLKKKSWTMTKAHDESVASDIRAALPMALVHRTLNNHGDWHGIPLGKEGRYTHIFINQRNQKHAIFVSPDSWEHHEFIELPKSGPWASGDSTGGAYVPRHTGKDYHDLKDYLAKTPMHEDQGLGTDWSDPGDKPTGEDERNALAGRRKQAWDRSRQSASASAGTTASGHAGANVREGEVQDKLRAALPKAMVQQVLHKHGFYNANLVDQGFEEWYTKESSPLRRAYTVKVRPGGAWMHREVAGPDTNWLNGPETTGKGSVDLDKHLQSVLKKTEAVDHNALLAAAHSGRMMHVLYDHGWDKEVEMPQASSFSHESRPMESIVVHRGGNWHHLSFKFRSTDSGVTTRTYIAHGGDYLSLRRHLKKLGFPSASVAKKILKHTEARRGHTDLAEQMIFVRLTELTFSKESLQNSLSKLDVHTASRWIALAGGHHKLHGLIKGLAQNYGIEVPDSAWATMKDASKGWVKAAKSHQIKYYKKEEGREPIPFDEAAPFHDRAEQLLKSTGWVDRRHSYDFTHPGLFGHMLSVYSKNWTHTDPNGKLVHGDNTKHLKNYLDILHRSGGDFSKLKKEDLGEAEKSASEKMAQQVGMMMKRPLFHPSLDHIPADIVDRLKAEHPVHFQPDTRDIFTPKTSRKSNWDEMKSHDYHSFPPEHQAALHKLPVMHLPMSHQAYDHHPDFAEDPIEKLVHRGSKTYYVNSEGYPYARYGFHIKNFPKAKHEGMDEGFWQRVKTQFSPMDPEHKPDIKASRAELMVQAKQRGLTVRQNWAQSQGFHTLDSLTLRTQKDPKTRHPQGALTTQATAGPKSHLFRTEAGVGAGTRIRFVMPPISKAHHKDMPMWRKLQSKVHYIVNSGPRNIRLQSVDGEHKAVLPREDWGTAHVEVHPGIGLGSQVSEPTKHKLTAREIALRQKKGLPVESVDEAKIPTQTQHTKHHMHLRKMGWEPESSHAGQLTGMTTYQWKHKDFPIARVSTRSDGTWAVSHIKHDPVTGYDIGTGSVQGHGKGLLTALQKLAAGELKGGPKHSELEPTRPT